MRARSARPATAPDAPLSRCGLPAARQRIGRGGAQTRLIDRERLALGVERLVDLAAGRDRGGSRVVELVVDARHRDCVRAEFGLAGREAESGEVRGRAVAAVLQIE